MKLFISILILFLTSCNSIDVLLGPESDNSSNERIRDIGGSPSQASRDIYESADLKDLCVDAAVCAPPYAQLPESFIRTEGQEPLDPSVCNFDYDPNLSSAFVLNRATVPINGIDPYFSREDLFFLAWVSVRYRINPYFLMSIMSAESAGNCAAVSGSAGEGCFQITNTFGQAQLDESYPERVAEWFWSDRSGSYYPERIFVDEESWFGERVPGNQNRITIDPSSGTIDGVDVSSVINFQFGVNASGLYFHWQHYLLYRNYSDLRTTAADLFAEPDQKAQWQAAAYNGGAYGAALAMRRAGENFLDEMRSETQNYAPKVTDFCTEFQAGEATYSTTYSWDQVSFIIDLLSDTYPVGSVDWERVREDVRQTFFPEGDEELSLVDDIKALIYVISTSDGVLGPEWAEF